MDLVMRARLRDTEAFFLIHVENQAKAQAEFPKRMFRYFAALMAKMKMTARERPRVKLECLRLLATLRLDPARSKLIGGFVDSYLKLSAEELKQYERELETIEPKERQTTMALASIWEQESIIMGALHGKWELIALQVQDRFGAVPAEVTARLDRLTSDQFNDLARALLRFDTLADLERWLAQH